jgi:hypothetical protein
MAEWQPGKTAPYDGMSVIIATEDGDVGLAEYHGAQFEAFEFDGGWLTSFLVGSSFFKRVC